MNERLRTTMLRHGVALEALAETCGVEPKTVERWLNSGRIPHRRHRWAAAGLLSTDETYLWPDVALKDHARTAQANRSELIEIFPDRASVPRELWLRLLSDAQEAVDILVFSGTFFAQTQPRVAGMLADAVERGVNVRICFGDPKCEAVAIRDREEGLGGTLAAKIRSALTYYRQLPSLKGCEVRLHSTTLYASLFRYDDEILVNPHAYGEAASANMTMHLRHLDGGTMAGHYMASFDRVWENSLPWDGAEV